MENPQLETVTCPLCHDASNPDILTFEGLRTYLHCGHCDLRFLHKEHLLPPDQESERYLLHQNDVNDLEYQRFVKPLCDVIAARTQPGCTGLDFGAGTGPVTSYLLQRSGYSITLYDPFFHPDKVALANKYDFVFACEVVEHFYHPAVEFSTLANLLKPKGFMALMTALVTENVDFKTWYYRKDPTHVVFYSQKTMQWIAQKFGFTKPQIIDDRVVVFEKNS